MARIHSWWSSMSYLPQWGAPLRYFMSASLSMTAGVLFGSEKPKVVWENIPTAYADQKNNKIAISATMLSERPSERLNPNVSKEETLDALHGVYAHELAHFVFSPATIPDLLNAGIPHTNLSGTIANLVEDVFIEHAIVERDSSFGWMIRAAWDYVFPEEKIEKFIAEWDGVSLIDLDKVVNVMCGWKNQSHYFEFRSELEEKLHTMLMSAKGMYDVQERKNLTEKIYRFLLDERKEETGEDLEEIKEGSEEFDKLMEALKELLKGMDLDKVQPSIEGTMIEVEISHVLSTMEDDNALIMDRYCEFSDFSMDGNILVSWTKVRSKERGKLTFDKKWTAFSKWAADRGTVRRIRGAAGISGRLTHPANLYDTGKVYSKATLVAPNGTTAFNGAPQDIILVDLSGSMGGGSRSLGTTKLAAACSAAQGAMEGLLAAKHRVAVYGHTTMNMGVMNESCLIREIKTFADNVDSGTLALYNIVKDGAESSNADSYAVEAVAKKFKQDGSPMRLWVISDGQPACSLYSGDSGIVATKKVVDKLRKIGIEVYSFSVDSAAIDPNNRIYGVNNNFNAQDTDVVRQVMKRFV